MKANERLIEEEELTAFRCSGSVVENEGAQGLEDLERSWRIKQPWVVWLPDEIDG